MTKNRLLPETDLARIALLPDDEKLAQLRQVKLAVVPYSYTPFRNVVAGIFNTRKPLFGDLQPCSLRDIESAIEHACRNRPKWLTPNLQLARIFYAFRQQNIGSAFERTFGAVSVGFGAKLKFWNDFFYDQDGLPVVCYVDPRRPGSGLTTLGRRFAFSIMHHNLAVNDFSEAKFQIFRFPSIPGSKDKKRSVEMFEFDPVELLDENELNEAITRTYQLWHKVLEERREEARRTAAGGNNTGSLL